MSSGQEIPMMGKGEEREERVLEDNLDWTRDLSANILIWDHAQWTQTMRKFLKYWSVMSQHTSNLYGIYNFYTLS